MKKMTLDEIKKVELGILKNLVAYLEENNLRYIIDYGTLLGAIRHGGFIPWDDDIDISMPRPDYERLLQLVKERPIDGVKMNHARDGENGVNPYAKAVDEKTIVQYSWRYEKYNTPVWVDIFPVDGFKDENDLQERIKKMKEWDYYREKACYKYPIKKSGIGGMIRKLIKWVYVNIIGPKRYIDKIEKCAQEVPYNNSEKGYIYVPPYSKGEILDKTYLEDTIFMKFEDLDVRVPREFDRRLTEAYGDYMKLPPEEQRKPHEIEAFWI